MRLSEADGGANGSGVGGYGIIMRATTLVRAYSSILYTTRNHDMLMAERAGLRRHASFALES